LRHDLAAEIYIGVTRGRDGMNMKNDLDWLEEPFTAIQGLEGTTLAKYQSI